MGDCVEIENGMVAGYGWDRGWGEAHRSSFLMVMTLGVVHRVVGVLAVIELSGENGVCPRTVVV